MKRMKIIKTSKKIITTVGYGLVLSATSIAVNQAIAQDVEKDGAVLLELATSRVLQTCKLWQSLYGGLTRVATAGCQNPGAKRIGYRIDELETEQTNW